MTVDDHSENNSNMRNQSIRGEVTTHFSGEIFIEIEVLGHPAGAETAHRNFCDQMRNSSITADYEYYGQTTSAGMLAEGLNWASVSWDVRKFLAKSFGVRAENVTLKQTERQSTKQTA